VKTTFLLACGVIAGPLFIFAFLISGAARADYNPLRHPISSLALGDLGWVQVANFIMTGLLLLAFALGTRRVVRSGPASTWGPILIAGCAIGFLGAGYLPADPLSGYPPGTPDLPLARTIQGVLHDLFSSLFFFGLPAACVVFALRFAGRGERGWAAYSVITAVVFAVAFALSSIAFRQSPTFVDFGGLFQRFTVAVGFSWLTLLGAHLYQEAAATA
jgi:hypothetical protein